MKTQGLSKKNNWRRSMPPDFEFFGEGFSKACHERIDESSLDDISSSELGSPEIEDFWEEEKELDIFLNAEDIAEEDSPSKILVNYDHMSLDFSGQSTSSEDENFRDLRRFRHSSRRNRSKLELLGSLEITSEMEKCNFQNGDVKKIVQTTSTSQSYSFCEEGYD